MNDKKYFDELKIDEDRFHQCTRMGVPSMLYYQISDRTR